MPKKRREHLNHRGDRPADAGPFTPSEESGAPDEVLSARDVAEDAQFVLELAQDAAEEAMD